MVVWYMVFGRARLKTRPLFCGVPCRWIMARRAGSSGHISPNREFGTITEFGEVRGAQLFASLQFIIQLTQKTFYLLIEIIVGPV